MQADPDPFRLTGTIWLLNQVHWRYFVTIPLPHRRGMKQNDAQRIWNGFRGRFAKSIGHSPRDLLWAVSLERGESRTNPHLHALLGGRLEAFNRADISETMARIGSQMDLSRIEATRYDSRRNAASYICKEQSGSEKLSASSDGHWPMISESVQRALARLRNKR